MTRAVEITGLEDEPIASTLRAFLANNADVLTPDDAAAIEALQVGESFTGGGGAWMAWTVTRTA